MLLALVLGTVGTVCAQNKTVQYGKENLERDYCTGYNITVYCKAIIQWSISMSRISLRCKWWIVRF